MDFLAIDGSVVTIPAERIYDLARESPEQRGSVVSGLELKKELHKKFFGGRTSDRCVEILCDGDTRLDSATILSCAECLDKKHDYRFVLVDLPRVWTNRYSCVYMAPDGELKAWGDVEWGGDCSSVCDLLYNDVREIYASATAYCAVRDSDGALFTWGGDSTYGLSSSFHDPLKGDLDRIFVSEFAFAAIRKSDGHLFTWGASQHDDGGDCSAVTEELNGDIASIHSSVNGVGFVAIRTIEEIFCVRLVVTTSSLRRRRRGGLCSI